MKKYFIIGKDYLKKFYNGDLQKAIIERDGVLLDINKQNAQHIKLNKQSIFHTVINI